VYLFWAGWNRSASAGGEGRQRVRADQLPEGEPGREVAARDEVTAGEKEVTHVVLPPYGVAILQEQGKH